MLPFSNAFWATTLSLLTFTNAVPQVAYSLMAQQPPVARVGSEFIFDLFPGTFNSTSTISYTPEGLPSWLSWDTPSLAFFGTPTSADIGQQIISLTATDASGSVSSNFTLITTNYTSPGIHQSFTTQIGNPPVRVFSSVTAMPGGTGVSIPPYWSFSLGWAYDTFRLSRVEPTNGDLYMMARERGTVGIPSWLTFDNTTMTFNGTAPASGSYTVVVTGTDFWGYTAAQASFVIEVGTGYPIEMAQGGNFTDLNVLARQEVDYTVALDDVLYNGTRATADQVTLSLDQTNFPWLSLEGTKITGKVPDEYINGTVSSLYIPLTIASRNTSSTLSLLTWIPFDVSQYFFNTFTIPQANTSASQSIAVDISSYITNKQATVNATVNPVEAASWLVYHPDNSTLVGSVPKSVSYDSVNVVFTAAQGNQTATSDLLINIAGATGKNGTDGNAPIPNAHDHSGLSTGAKVGIAIGAIAAALLILALIWFCCWKRRRDNEMDEKMQDDHVSFVAQSPPLDPFRRSHGLHPTGNLLGEIARFSGLVTRNPSQKRKSDQPHRMDGLKGIFTLADEKDAKYPAVGTPHLTRSTSSFLGQGDVIGITDIGESRPSNDASSFTQSFDSESSRASWESRESYNWSSNENGDNGTPRRNRISTTPSIPRPRADFTPRYPRNNSPTVLAQLASQHSLGMPPGGSSSGSGSGHEDSMNGSFTGTGSITNSDFPSGPSGLGRFGDSGFRSIDEEDEETSGEEPAIVSMAERQSFETRQPHRPTPKLRPSRERIASPADSFGDRSPQSRQALVTASQGEEGMYDDAEEYRRSMIGRNDVGLGYPASAIFGGSDYGEERPKRSSTIIAIPQHDDPVSPPLPQVGSFVRQLDSPSESTRTTPGSANDGRVVACANETFSIHPQIHPPPTVSLSAATWSSAPPSTYRAEVEGGGQLPSWLHFDSRELELWGVPSLGHSGETTVIRIIEKLPRDKRRSDPMAFGYEPQQEREVGRVAIEVVDRVKSPQFALENSPHAL